MRTGAAAMAAAARLGFRDAAAVRMPGTCTLEVHRTSCLSTLMQTACAADASAASAASEPETLRIACDAVPHAVRCGGYPFRRCTPCLMWMR
jgi:hypothetical protein